MLLGHIYFIFLLQLYKSLLIFSLILTCLLLFLGRIDLTCPEGITLFSFCLNVKPGKCIVLKLNVPYNNLLTLIQSQNAKSLSSEQVVIITFAKA